MEEPTDAVTEITFNTLLLIAECYERDPTHEHQFHLETATQSLLERWAASIPQAYRELLRDRIERPIEFIRTREFSLEPLWLKAKELCVRYETGGVVEMYISITPTYILVKDYQFNLREAAFPLLQSSY